MIRCKGFVYAQIRAYQRSVWRPIQMSRIHGHSRMKLMVFYYHCSFAFYRCVPCVYRRRLRRSWRPVSICYNFSCAACNRVSSISIFFLLVNSTGETDFELRSFDDSLQVKSQLVCRKTKSIPRTDKFHFDICQQWTATHCTVKMRTCEPHISLMQSRWANAVELNAQKTIDLLQLSWIKFISKIRHTHTSVNHMGEVEMLLLFGVWKTKKETKWANRAFCTSDETYHKRIVCAFGWLGRRIFLLGFQTTSDFTSIQ